MKKEFLKTEKKRCEKLIIRSDWWSMGKKQIDFSCTIKEALNFKGIKVSIIENPQHKGFYGYRFLIPLNSCFITYTVFDGNYENCAMNALVLFLTAMGDRAIIKTSNYSKEVNKR